jgi:hypothetical protein
VAEKSKSDKAADRVKRPVRPDEAEKLDKLIEKHGGRG